MRKVSELTLLTAAGCVWTNFLLPNPPLIPALSRVVVRPFLLLKFLHSSLFIFFIPSLFLGHSDMVYRIP